MTKERDNATGLDASSAVTAALDEGRLLLVLQPIVDAVSGATAFYEGLLRLRQRDGTLISASALIQDAEKIGLAPLIDRRALALGGPLLARHPRLKLSLNVSSLTAHDKKWMADLRALTASEPELANRLTIEITETAMIHDLAAVATFVDSVRALGCKIAIDDFGAGYTSFRHLKVMKIDMLKIDGAFVTDLPNDYQSRVLAKTMIEMAHALGLETVAEWVGSAEAAAFLREVGANYLQGFLYGEPMHVEDLQRKGLL